MASTLLNSSRMKRTTITEQSGTKLYVPVEAQQPPSSSPLPNGSSPNGSVSGNRRSGSATASDESMMELDDSKYKVYIRNLDDELSSDSEAEDDNLIFLPDIEKHRIPAAKQSGSVSNDSPPEFLGGIGGMQRIMKNLARRGDVPDEWWAEAGVSRTLALHTSGSKPGSDSPHEILGGIGGMQRIVRNLARREDIPDEWWAEAGLSRTLALHTSGSKPGSDSSTFNSDTKSLAGPSTWNKGRATNAGDDTVQSQKTKPQIGVEEPSNFRDSDLKQSGTIRPDAVEDQQSDHPERNLSHHPERFMFEGAEIGHLHSSSNSHDFDSDEAEHLESLRKHRKVERRRFMISGQLRGRTFSQVLGSDGDMENLGPSHVRGSGSSVRRLHRRTSLASEYPPPSISELEEPESYEGASRHGQAEGYAETKKIQHWLDASKSQDGESRSPLLPGTRAKVLATTLSGMDAKKLYDKHEHERGREHSRSPTSSPNKASPGTAAVAGLPQHYRRTRSRSRDGRSGSRSRLRTGEIAAAALAGLDAKKLYDERNSKRDREGTELAHRRAAAKEDAQRLDWFYADAAHGTEDSDTSDVESIMSEAPSIASSRSSVPLNIDLGAIQELRTLLLTNEALVPLYDVAISKVGPERFYRNFRRLLLRYGRALSTEAASSVQLKAARFVRFAASRVSMQIKDKITNKDVKEQGKGISNANALGDYLQQMQDVDDSSTEDSEHDPEEASLQTLESVKSFMLSSTAFSELCHSLRVWLGVETQNKLHNAPILTITKVEAKESEYVEILTASSDHQPMPPKDESPKLDSRCKDPAQTPLPILAKSEEATARGRRVIGESVPFWTSVMRTTRKLVSNRLSGLWQASPPPGYVKISWICRCGDILRIQVPEAQQRAAIAFAEQAAGPNSSTVVSQSSNGTASAPSGAHARAATEPVSQSTDRPSLTPSSSNASATTDTTTDSYSTSATTRSAGSRPESPNTVPSDEELSQPEPFLPAGTKKYMLLCVNTLRSRGIPQRKLANVDVTDIECDAEMFQRLRNAYYALRPRRNPFFVPKTMHYVKFQLLFLQKSGECIGAYEVDSIPSRNEVIKQEYAFSPCPPRIGKLPLPPNIFMHGFLDPGDHLGVMAVEMLPKKLWSQLRWDARANDRYNMPAGWGFYIVEGINWSLVSWCTAVALIAVTTLTMSWSIWAGDIQGGTGLGQYCLAVLTVSVSVWLLKYSVEPSGHAR